MADVIRKIAGKFVLSAAFFAVSLSLAACSATDDPLIAQTSSLTDLSQSKKPISVDEASDKQAIKTALLANASEAQGPNSTLALAWANDETGNSGTITAIEKQINPQGTTCYSFITTLENLTGISLYDAETCELAKGQWVMSLFRSKQAA